MDTPRKTPYSKEAEIYFVTSQLASYFKAGIAANRALKEVGDKQRNPHLKEALHLAAARATEGSNLASTFALYPYLFPRYVVGGIRAGETGGYLPEALQRVADQADSSRKMRRWMVWLGWAVVGLPPIIPIGKAFFNSVLSTWKVQDESGGTAPVGPALWSGFVQELSSPYMIAWLIACVLFVGAVFVWQSMRFRPLRQRMVLGVPAVGKRARSESFANFTWHLANLSHAAISPRQAYLLAADTAPNDHVYEKLMSEGRRMTDQSKLSETLERTGLLPWELSAMVQTGETTGDVAGQLFAGAQSQQEELVQRDRDVKNRVMLWMFLVVFVIAPVVVIYVYGDFLQGLIRTITE